MIAAIHVLPIIFHGAVMHIAMLAVRGILAIGHVTGDSLYRLCR